MKAILSLGLLAALLLSTGCLTLKRAMHEIRWADIEQPQPTDKSESPVVAAN